MKIVDLFQILSRGIKFLIFFFLYCNFSTLSKISFWDAYGSTTDWSIEKKKIAKKINLSTLFLVHPVLQGMYMQLISKAVVLRLINPNSRKNY